MSPQLIVSFTRLRRKEPVVRRRSWAERLGTIRDEERRRPVTREELRELFLADLERVPLRRN